MPTSMIKGNPLKLMLQFTFPLLLGNLLQQTYNIIDAAIVGQILGAKALASVEAGSSIQFLVLGFWMGSCTGFGVPVAKYFGAEKIEKMRDYIFNGAVLCAGIAVILTVLCSVLCPRILHIQSVPEDIYDNAYSYLMIIFLGIPFTILYNYLFSILRSVGVGYGIAAGILLIFAGRTLSMLFVGKSAVAVLDASAKYLRCMGFFYWSLGILNVARMVTQGLGYSGRAVFSGVTEMIARTVVCLGFVVTFGFTAICFADQTAWITATCYIFSTCLWYIRKSTRMLVINKKSVDL